MDARRLTYLMTRASPTELAAAFTGMDEAGRRALRPEVIALRRTLAKGEAPPTVGLGDLARRALGVQPTPAVQVNPALALLACGTLAEVRRIDFYGHRDADRAALLRILQDRRPPWLQAWVEHCLSARDWPLISWQTVRALLAAGLCTTPNAAGYVRQMTLALNTWPWREPQAYVPLHRQLLDQPDLIPLLWRLFEVETAAFEYDWRRGRTNLPADYEDWPTALLRLAALGVLDRGRLLDETLAATWRVENTRFQGAQVALHLALAPTDAERLARAGAYLDLVRHRTGPVVSFGLRRVAWLLERGALDWPRVARATPAVFQLRARTQGIAALRLLGRGVAAGALAAADLAEPLRAALAQGQAEVQAAALDLAARVPDPGGFLAALIAEYRDDLPASLRGGPAAAVEPVPEPDADGEPGPDAAVFAQLAALPAWVRVGLGLADRGPDAAPAAATGPVWDDLPPPLRFQTWQVPQLTEPLPPVASVDELVDLASQLVETVPDVAALERLIDGIGRLGAQRPEGFAQRTAPLRKRLAAAGTSALTHGILGAGTPSGFGDLLDAWLRRRRPLGLVRPWFRLVGPVRLLQRRLLELARRVAAGVEGPVLAAPTHAGGWIDPGVLVERVARAEALGLPALPVDAALALLRLAPEGRGEALATAAGIDGDLARALRFALGGDTGPDRADRAAAPLWVAAARARWPDADLREPLAPLALRADWPDLLRPATWTWVAGQREFRHRGRDGRYPTLDLAADPPWPLRVETPVWHRPRGLVGAAAALGRAGRSLLRRVAGVATSGQAEGPIAFASVLLHERAGRHWGILGLAAPWQIEALTWLWPARPEPLLAWGADLLLARLDLAGATSEPGHPFLLPLLHPDLAWSELVRLALWLGLLSRDRDARALALDALIAGIDDGRADPQALAATLTRLSAGGWVKPNRVAAVLAEAARPSPLHGLVAGRLIECHLIARGVGGEDHPLLAVLNETLAGLDRPLDPALPGPLAVLKGKGKAATLARALVARNGEARGPANREALRAAWTARLERGARWAAAGNRPDGLVRSRDPSSGARATAPA